MDERRERERAGNDDREKNVWMEGERERELVTVIGKIT